MLSVLSFLEFKVIAKRMAQSKGRYKMEAGMPSFSFVDKGVSAFQQKQFKHLLQEQYFPSMGPGSLLSLHTCQEEEPASVP
jgi:hypothetical protein